MCWRSNGLARIGFFLLQCFCLFVTAANVAAHENPAVNTFVFLINGAEDHSVLGSRSSSETVQADQWDAEKIRELAETCKDCNVVLLHVQSPKVKKISHLWVFARGKSVVSKQVREFTSANAHALSELLKSAEKLFPFSRIHLIYRAHSFVDRLHEFAQGLKLANLKAPLSSLIFASCSMAFLEVASAVAPYAKYMIATQTDVVETQDFGFDYSFLQYVHDDQSEAQVADMIADTLLSSFRVNDDQLEKAYLSAAPIMESSITLIRLEQMGGLADRFEKLLQKNRDAIVETCKVTKLVADRYIHFLKSKQADVSTYLNWRWDSYAKKNYIDLICFLRTLDEGAQLIVEFKAQLTVRDRPHHSTKEGLSFIWEAS